VAGIERSLPIFSAASCRVIVVSFGSVQGAAGWLQSTGCELEMYLDQERVLYNSLGLQRSVSKVWNIATINYYASQVAEGRKLPTAMSGVEDDPLQMGGDFTFHCEQQTLVMTHQSKTPKDRPTIDNIIQRIQKK